MPIKDYFATCLLTGTDFSPAKLQKISSLGFYSSREKGEISKHRKIALNYGGAIINRPSHIGLKGEDIKLKDLLKVLIKNKSKLKTSGVEDINVTLALGYEGDMSAWHIEYEDLKKLVELEIGLSIDYYEVD